MVVNACSLVWHFLCSKRNCFREFCRKIVWVIHVLCMDENMFQIVLKSGQSELLLATHGLTAISHASTGGLYMSCKFSKCCRLHLQGNIWSKNIPTVLFTVILVFLLSILLIKVKECTLSWCYWLAQIYIFELYCGYSNAPMIIM